MQAFFEKCISGPTLPATILAGICMLYWLMVIVGSADLDAFDFDLDADLDGDAGSLVSVGLVPLRFLNLGRVPLMLWLSIFSLAMWMLSMILDHNPAPATPLLEFQAVVRNTVLALVTAKLLTNPLRDRFDPVEPDSAAQLIGRTCEIVSTEVTAEHIGQARLLTGAAPLLLNVRAAAEQQPLTRGQVAVLTAYETERNTFLVAPHTGEEPA